ncbi:glycosyl transferase [Actinomycetospora sp. NBRC 106375]|nr:glycosyl transferase [Actinomycetospora sp. NBRC 106375]
MVRQHYVPQDSRVARAVEALAATGAEVDVWCLRAPGQPRRERSGRVTVHRLPLRHRRGTKLGYLVEYGAFGVLATLVLTVAQLRRRYRLVEVHSLPDALVFAAAPARLLGARVLLDLQECMPEFFATRFGADHPAVGALAAIEQRAIAFADRVITPTEQMRAVFVGRGAPPGRITTVMDGADPAVFAPPADDGRRGARFTVVCHGTVEPHYGLDTVVRAIDLVRRGVPAVRLEVIGDGSDLPRLRGLVADLGLDDHVGFSGGFLPVGDLVAALAAADVGVVAMVRDPFRDVALPGKVFDFVAMGLPVVASRTRSMEETFGPDAVELFTSGDPEELARALRRLHDDPARRARITTEAARVVEPLRWERQRATYLAVVDELV